MFSTIGAPTAKSLKSIQQMIEASLFKLGREFFHPVNIFIAVADEDVIFGFIIWNENKSVGNNVMVTFTLYTCILTSIILLINKWLMFED